MLLTKIAKDLEKAGVAEDSANYIVENLNHAVDRNDDIKDIKKQLIEMQINNERRFSKLEGVVKIGIIMLTVISAPTFVGMMILLFNLFLKK